MLWKYFEFWKYPKNFREMWDEVYYTFKNILIKLRSSWKQMLLLPSLRIFYLFPECHFYKLKKKTRIYFQSLRILFIRWVRFLYRGFNEILIFIRTGFYGNKGIQTSISPKNVGFPKNPEIFIRKFYH